MKLLKTEDTTTHDDDDCELLHFRRAGYAVFTKQLNREGDVGLTMAHDRRGGETNPHRAAETWFLPKAADRGANKKQSILLPETFSLRARLTWEEDRRRLQNRAYHNATFLKLRKIRASTHFRVTSPQVRRRKKPNFCGLRVPR